MSGWGKWKASLSLFLRSVRKQAAKRLGEVIKKLLPMQFMQTLDSIVCMQRIKTSNDILQQIRAQLDRQATILHRLQKQHDPQRHLNATEAAEYIGISPRLFNERLKLGMWTNMRIGRRRVFRPSELDADLDAFKERSRYRKPAA